MSSSRLKLDDGLELYMKRWSVPSPVNRKAVILFNHGFSEHMDGYDGFFSGIAAQGYEVIGFDQRGAGQTSPSKKEFGNTNEFHVFHDLDQVLENIFSEFPNTPLFLWGHSMGGGIVLNYGVKGTKRDDVFAYIADAPLVEVHPDTQPNRVLGALLPLLAKIYPKYKQKIAINYQYLSDDQAKVEGYKNDPLRRNLATAEQARDFLARGRRLLDPTFVDKFVDKPVLVNHGTDDRINSYDGSKRFFDLLKIKNKTFHTYPGWLHELAQMSAPKAEEHRRNVVNWMDRVLKDVTTASTGLAQVPTAGAPISEPVGVAKTAEPQSIDTVAPKQAERETAKPSEREPAVPTAAAAVPVVSATTAPITTTAEPAKPAEVVETAKAEPAAAVLEPAKPFETAAAVEPEAKPIAEPVAEREITAVTEPVEQTPVSTAEAIERETAPVAKQEVLTATTATEPTKTVESATQTRTAPEPEPEATPVPEVVETKIAEHEPEAPAPQPAANVEQAIAKTEGENGVPEEEGDEKEEEEEGAPATPDLEQEDSEAKASKSSPKSNKKKNKKKKKGRR